MKTIMKKSDDHVTRWYVVDAEGKRLGRVAEKVARVLRGKHKPEFLYHQDVGDYVIILNAAKAELSGNKKNAKFYYRHSGYPGGLTTESYEKVIQRKPTFPMEHAVKGMLPKGPLGRKLFRHVKVYAGTSHPHTAQQPETLEL
jgi:large subunit ribosomal protein L13